IPMESSDTNEVSRQFSKKNTWKKSRLLAVASIKANPIASILIDKYTENNRVNVERLTIALLRFIKTSDLEEKLRFVFDCYDINSNGRISFVELFGLLKLLNRGILPDQKIQNIVNRTFAEVGEYKREIEYEDFKKLLLSTSNNLVELFYCKR
ncbi:serine/threonine-protein phosphatase 2B regulatory subunit, partial [Pancytospora epiphaga]